MKTFIVSAVGKTEEEAIDLVSGGWFTSSDIPSEAIQLAHARGEKIFLFNLHVESLGEVCQSTVRKPPPPP